MASIKVKFRKSTVEGKPGTIYYQICHDSVSGQITTNMHVLPKEWDYENARIRTISNKETNYKLLRYRFKIESDIKQLVGIIKHFDDRGTGYTVKDIKKTFETNTSTTTVLHYMSMTIEKLRTNRHYGTAKNYQCALNSFSNFLGDEDISFNLMNEGLIMEYSLYLNSKGIVKNSISFYMRILRAVYNRAVKERIVEQSHPFNNVYTGIGRTRKRAVDENTIIKLTMLDLRNRQELDLSRDMFIFSYCTRGMAFVDIAYLKKTNIEGNFLIYTRRKTDQLMMIKIEPCIRYYINKYELATANSLYVFPILKTNDEHHTYNEYINALSLHNLRLKKISILAGIQTPLSSYIPRHTWATTARNHNIPISIISAGMGHTSEKTTEIYLASVENTVVDEANSGILEKLNKLFSF